MIPGMRYLFTVLSDFSARGGRGSVDAATLPRIDGRTVDSMLKEFLQNSKALIYAVLVHLAFAVLISNFDWMPKPEGQLPGRVIQAQVVDESKLRAEAERRRQAAEAKQRRKEDESQRELDRKRRPEGQRRAEAQRNVEDQPRVREEGRVLKEQTTTEQARPDAEKEQADKNHELRLVELRGQYVNDIKQQVESNWLRPSGEEDGLHCKVHVVLGEGGTVLDAVASECNGDAAFKRSVEAAVLKSSPFPAPTDLTLFDRNLNFEFEPEGEYGLENLSIP